MDLELTAKRVVVTGGSRGIGRAIATSLAKEGADVVLAARSVGRLEEAAADLSHLCGRPVHAVMVDTGDNGSVKEMTVRVKELLGGVDILVNAAAVPGGQSTPPKLAEIDDEAAWADINVKLFGYLHCTRAVAPGMIASGWGRIINISGLAARSTGSSIGSIRNVAVAALTKNLGDELGPFGINVTALHPGITRTEGVVAMIDRTAAAEGAERADIEQRLSRGSAIGRMVTTDEVAAVAAFLASPKSVAINGDAIACGGGQLGTIHY